MKKLLSKINIFHIVLLLLVFSGNVNGQTYTITGNVSSSTLACTTFTGYNVISIGNGSTASSLIMNDDLDLRTCSLGSLQVVVNNATIDFSSSNKRLYLPEGSSISFINGGTLNPPGGNGGGCTGNDRIYMGTVLLAACQGGSGILGFDDIINLGGTGSATSNSPFCVGNTVNLSATPPPNGGPYTYSWSGPNGYSSTSRNPASFSATTTPNIAGVYSVTMTSTTLSTNKSITAQTTVVVNSASAPATPTITASGSTTFCSGGSVTLTSSTGSSYLWSTGATTQSISPTNSGSYSVRVTNAGGCQSNLSVATVVTVNSLVNNVTNGFSSSSFCLGDQATITFDANNLSGVYPYTLVYRNDTTSATASVIVANDNATAFNVVPNPTVTTDYTLISITDANGCVRTSGFVDATARVTINNVFPNTPTIATTQPTCAIATGTITITGVVGETYSFDGGAYSSTLVYSGLTQGSSHTIYAKNSSGCISAVTNSTINSIVTNTYSGTWSAGSAPTSGTQNIVFNAGYTATTDLSGCSCTVNLGNVIVNSDKILTITNGVIVNAGGSLTFENNASLVQINTIPNIGNITYKRNYTGGQFDYTYWSSPVAGQNLLAFSPSTKLDKFFSFNSIANDWVLENPTTASMAIGKGYIIRGIPPPPGPPPGFGTNSFIGVPNNGNISVSVVFTNPLNLLSTDPEYGVSYLLGNPYPSAIYADQFLYDNQSVIGGTLYFWTHNTPIAIGTPDPGTGAWAYSGNDYASYNITGGVGTGSGTAALSGGVEPSGKIAAGQGFFATSIATGTVNFNNAMRLDSSGNSLDNSNFYKTRSPKSKTTNSFEKHRVWLNLTNTQGAFKQTLVGYITGATNAWDGLYDGESYDGNDFLDFYSVNEDKNLTIQGRALPFDVNDEIPLGYRVALDGTFTIKIGKTDGVLSSEPVFIEDKLTNTVFDLKSGNYTFTTVAGTFDNRFVLRYTDKTLSTEEVVLNDGITVLYSNNYKTLIIKNNLQETKVISVSLYNMTGQKINNWDVLDNNQTSIQIPIKNLPSEIYIVKVKTTKGESSKKIIIK